MAFSQTGISDVRIVSTGSDLFVTWSASIPPGMTVQVYVDRRLAWYGTSRRCHVPIPAVGLGRNIWVEVGAVDADEATLDFSSRLVAPNGRCERVQLSWSGGTYLDPTGEDDIQGFQIYQGPSAGAAVDLTTSVGFVVAYPGGWINDGFGKGGFGDAGFGRAATPYTWESGPLTSGTWQFAVVPSDKAGNAQGAGQTVTATVNAAPRPPAMDANRSRLNSTYAGPSNPQLTLNWQSSPSE